MVADQPFQSVIDSQLQHTGVAPAKMFGALGLGVKGKYYAMLYKGRLVVKLPRQRVDGLVADGLGEGFDPGHGRIMKEWVAIGPERVSEWQALAEEARHFVAADG